MAYGYNYSYPYNPPMQDQLAQLRNNPMQPMYPNQFQPPMNQPVQQPAPQNQQPVTNNMIWVQGEAGAKSFIVANGNTVPLWDSENQTVYIKTVDASGIPSMRVLDYTERTAAPRAPAAAPQAPAVEYVTRAEFDALAAELEALKAKKCTCSKKTVKEDADNA